MGEPVYVCHKDMTNNTVTVGPNESLFHSKLRAKDWNWIPFPDLAAPMKVMAKVRYRHSPQPAIVTSGQLVVLYDGDMVVGGGTITEILP